MIRLEHAAAPPIAAPRTMQISPVRLGAVVFFLCLALIVLTLVFAREMSVQSLGDADTPPTDFSDSAP